MDQPPRENTEGFQRLLSLWSSRHLDIVAGAFWISVTSYLVSSAWDFGKFDVVVGLAGTASCGFSWLLARALFRPDADRETWALLVIGGLILTGVILDLLVETPSGTGFMGHFLGMASSVHSLLSSSVLLLTFVEACLGYRPDSPNHEKRFRILFIAGYVSLLFVAVLWVNGAPETSWTYQSASEIKLVCASIAIILSVLAWRFRRNYPLPPSKRRQRRRINASVEDEHIANRIIILLERDRLYLEPDMQLSNFSRRIGEKSYRVSAIVTGVLGYSNFNTLINQYRINTAKEELQSQLTNEKSILAIALDSGFSSIGPFNRAFKRETGVTPSEFRMMNSVSRE